MEWYWIILIVIGGLIASYLIYLVIISFYMVHAFTHPHFDTRENRKKLNHSYGFDKFAKAYQRNDITFKMSDGYLIHGDYSINDPHKFIIFVHGHASTREGCIKYTQAFYHLGYSLILYDLRSHGDNKRSYVSMGYQESKDLNEIINQVKDKFGQDIEIGLFGVSMGGATTLLLTQYRQDIKFIVSDCAFASLKDMCTSKVHQHHGVAHHFNPLVNLIFKCKYHFSFKDIEPYKVLQSNTIPVLFIQGEKDQTVLVANAFKLYQNNKGLKRLELFPNAGHGQSINKDKHRYLTIAEEFIKEVGA